MASRQARRIQFAPKPRPPVRTESPYERFRLPAIALGLVCLVLGYYLVPLFSDRASIQRDAVDVHYSLQKYFSEQLHHGKIPVWTPYVFSGMPLLADPEIGAWYPLNWPFFLAGITARGIEWELFLHAAIACLGAWLLALDLLESSYAAILAAIFYAFSGFFAAHSSHVGMFQVAALFPWLLWSFRRAVLKSLLRYGPLCAAVGALLMLAGHFQTALYSFFGLFLFAVSLRRLKAMAILAGVMAAAIMLSCIAWLPALELASQSIRSTAEFHSQTNSPLVPGALLTLFFPNYYGALHGPYHGPADITQFYFYAGLLLPVLALAGLMKNSMRPLAAIMLIPTLWYALGPSAGLYRLIAVLPGFRSVRAPVDIWFVAALVLAILAAAGAQFPASHFRKPWLIGALATVAFGNVYFWNMDGNPLAYAADSFDALYGNNAAQFDAITQPLHSNPLNRLFVPADNKDFGPLNGALAAELETTYGYNPLELQAYTGYMISARTNTKLLNGLGVTHGLDLSTRQVFPNRDALPRATFPAHVLSTGSLATLDPATATILTANPGPFQQDPQAKVEITGYEGSLYRMKYSAATPSIMRIAVPYFPGWYAAVDGTPAPVFVLDQALSGVLVPAGSHELLFRFNLKSLTTALIVSLSAWLILLAAFCFTLLGGPAPSSPSAVRPQESPTR